jgi:tetratricopeptide (TPR) repeat protein
MQKIVPYPALFFGTMITFLLGITSSPAFAQAGLPPGQPPEIRSAGAPSPAEVCLNAAIPPGRDKQNACDNALATSSADSLERAHINAVISSFLIREGRIDDARRSIEEALAIAPDDTLVLNNWGGVLLRQSSFAAATDAYSKALQVTNEADLAAVLYKNRSLALRGLGEYREAAADYAEYLRLIATMYGQGRSAPSDDPNPLKPRN